MKDRFEVLLAEKKLDNSLLGEKIEELEKLSPQWMLRSHAGDEVFEAPE